MMCAHTRAYYTWGSVCHCRLKSSAYCCKCLQNNIKLLSQRVQYNIAYCKRALYPIIILIIPTAAVHPWFCAATRAHAWSIMGGRDNENTRWSFFFCRLLRDDGHNILICTLPALSPPPVALSDVSQVARPKTFQTLYINRVICCRWIIYCPGKATFRFIVLLCKSLYH